MAKFNDRPSKVLEEWVGDYHSQPLMDGVGAPVAYTIRNFKALDVTDTLVPTYDCLNHECEGFVNKCPKDK